MERTYTDFLFEYYERHSGDLNEKASACATLEAPKADCHTLKGKKIKNILIIDDEANIRSVYHDLLTRQGMKVYAYSNINQARPVLLRKKIDLVMLDINLPEVEGQVLFEILKSFHKDVKVIVSSVYGVEEQKELIPDADEYFDKSDGTEELLRKITHVLDGCSA